MDPQQPPEPTPAGPPPAEPPPTPAATPPDATPPGATPPGATPPTAGSPAAPPPSLPPAGPPPATQPAPPPTYPAPAAAWQQAPMELGPAPGVRFASHVPRLIAYLVDGALLTIVIVLVTLVLAPFIGLSAANDNTGATAGVSIFLALLIIVLSVAYFPFFWARGGQTPGMRIFRLRVVRDVDGGPISGGAAVLRLIGYWVSSAVFYLGFIWILVDKRRRGWHDLIAGTIVIEQ